MRPSTFKMRHRLGMKGLYIVSNNEIQAFVKNQGFIISLLIQPILYYIFIVLGINNFVTQVNYEGQVIAYADYALTGILGILIISQMTQTLYRIVIDKKYGLFALKRQSGVAPIYYILGMSVYPIIGLSIQSATLLIIAKLCGSSMNVIHYLMGMVMMMIVLCFWTAVAALISIYINDYQRRDTIVSFIITPLGFTAPAFYVMSNVPTFINVIGHFNPLTYQLQAIRSVIFGTSCHLVVMLVCLATIMMLGIAATAVARVKLVLSER